MMKMVLGSDTPYNLLFAVNAERTLTQPGPHASRHLSLCSQPQSSATRLWLGFDVKLAQLLWRIALLAPVLCSPFSQTSRQKSFITLQFSSNVF
jgi:hypothetical protein